MIRTSGSPAPMTCRVVGFALGLLLLTGSVAAQTTPSPEFDRLMEEGSVALQAGEAATAEPLFRRALALEPRHPVAQALLGNTLVDLDRANEAVFILREAVETAPELASAQYGLARAYLVVGRVPDAVRALEATLRLEPGNAAARLQLARALNRLNRLEEAHAIVRSLVGEAPDNYLAHELLGTIAARQERFGEALTAFEAAAALRPGDPLALRGKAMTLVRLDRDDEALAALQELLQASPDDRSGLIMFGDLLSRQTEDIDATITAARAYRRALELGAASPQLVGSLGELYLRLGMGAEGVAMLDATASAWSVQPEILLLRGRMLADQDLYRDARQALVDAIEAGAGARAWYALGIAEFNLGAMDESIAAFEKAIELQPTMGAAYRELGKVLLDRTRIEEALAALTRALELLSDDATAHYLAGTARLRAGDAAAALPLLQRAAELNSRDPQVFFALAAAYRGIGETANSAAATSTFQELTAATSGDRETERRQRVDGLTRQGMIRFQLGEAEAGLVPLQQAIGLDPEAPLPHYLVGLCYASLERWDDAIAALERNIELDPERPDGYAALGQVFARVGRQPEADAMLRRANELLEALQQQQR